ncbi:MAG TPA: selenocysteine-specific translation elongation factor [Candidatus Limnocylindrales bacterium]|nr:selenocysteine-specific translation elongation factor [Candidatus Limnocylindrales bacterium]
MLTVVVGTAGHIDHGKTTLLRALTGIDPDRLPEERERGMTIDVGFAHLALDDGTAIDFVDVPGHDRLVGNMLVGAGEIDAVLLVVAADDGPRAQTLEHLELLHALGLRHAVVAITKTDLVDPARVAEVGAAVGALVDRTSMAGAPSVAVSGATGTGIAALRERLVELRDVALRDLRAGPAGPLRLPIDRTFTVRGRGTVVTGTLRGGSLRDGTELRLQPSGQRRVVRVREVQVHHGRTDRADGGRTAVNVAGVEAGELRRGQVLAAGDGIVSTDVMLVALRRPVALGSAADAAVDGPWPPSTRATLRFHLWTESVEATIRSAGQTWLTRDGGAAAAGVPSAGGRHAVGESLAALVRLGHPIAATPGAAAVIRDPGSGRVVAGVTILDPSPPHGVSRRRATPERLSALAAAVAAGWDGSDDGSAVAAALTELHGFRAGLLAPDVAAVLASAAMATVDDGIAMADLRAHLARDLRRQATVHRSAATQASAAVDRVVADLVAGGSLARAGDRLRDTERRIARGDELAASMARLEATLDVDVPPSLAEAARAAGCPPEGLRQLEASGRIVRVEDDLAWCAPRYGTVRDLAVAMAQRGPLAPAAFRDALGGNRRVALALLEDLGRRGILRRTDAGHVLGPRAPGTARARGHSVP